MNLREAKESIGRKVFIEGSGDLAMDISLRPYIRHYLDTNTPRHQIFTFTRFTKSGLALIENEDKVLLSLPIKYLELLPPTA